MATLLRRGRLKEQLAKLLATVVVILLAWGAFGSQRPGAHAVLESSTPVDQAVLEEAPDRVSVTFNENVTFTPSGIRVFDGSGERVDTGDVRRGEDARTVTVGVDSGSATGSFAVAWQAVSADSHPVHGGFVYSVGKASHVTDLDRLVSSGDNPLWAVLGQVLRSLDYLSSLLAVAGAIFAAFIVGRREPGRGLLRVVVGAAVVTVVSSIAQIPQQAALAADLGPGSVFEPGVARQVLDAGVAWTHLGAIVAVVISVVAVFRKSQRSRATFAVAGVVLLVGSFAASGHSRTTSPVAVSTAAVVVHGVGAVLWAGLVLHLTWRLRERRLEELAADGEAGRVVQRLSTFATVALGAIAISGAVLAFQEVGSLEGLTSTTYGRLLGAKVALVAFVAAAGAYNHFRIVPLMRKEAPPRVAWQYLRRSLTAESIGLILIVGITAVLVSIMPARTTVELSRLYGESVPLGDGSVNMVIDPASTGYTEVHIYLLDGKF